jgi:hypothetical protein
MKQEPQIIQPSPTPPPPPKILNPNSSPTTNTPKVSQQQNIKINDIKSSNQSSINNNPGKSLEMATRVVPNPVKQQHTSRPSSTESTLSQVN